MVRLPQHPHGAAGGIAEGGDFIERIVESERGASGAGDAEACHEWLAAMMAGANGDSHLIEESTEVIGMDAIDGKGQGTAAIGWTVEADTVNLLKFQFRRAHESGLVVLDGSFSDSIDKIQCRREGYGSLDVRGAGFVFEGEVVVGGAAEADFFNHLAAATVGR